MWRGVDRLVSSGGQLRKWAGGSPGGARWPTAHRPEQSDRPATRSQPRLQDPALRGGGERHRPNVLTANEAQRIAQLGFNVVRLGVVWKGLEPGTDPINDAAICTPGAPRASGPGQFDGNTFDTYINRLEATVALLARYGIPSLIDMHQDVYNEAFGGEGAPNWAVCTSPPYPVPCLGRTHPPDGRRVEVERRCRFQTGADAFLRLRHFRTECGD